MHFAIEVALRFSLNPVTSMWPGSGHVISNCQGSCARGAGMPSHAARLQCACACDPSCAVACLWARPRSCAEKKALALSFFPQVRNGWAFVFPLLLSPCWPVGGIFQVEKDNVCFHSALCDLGGIRQMRKQDIADNTQKNQKQTKHENQKTTNEDEAAIRECGQGAPKVQPGSRGWVPSVKLIRKTTGQSDS